MDNQVVVFILTMIGSILVFFSLCAFVDGEDREFAYVFFFMVQFSFTTAMLFKMYDKIKKLEEKQVEKKRKTI
ncbi:hypothetical protein ACFW35_14515 [Fictibacillus sp. NPDC058756]|uniref:hypothetical protein n=1 Tax=Fictibacillus sp. NPDC058756 TaxID=3346625 RepID=UPI0036A4982A